MYFIFQRALLVHMVCYVTSRVIVLAVLDGLDSVLETVTMAGREGDVT